MSDAARRLRTVAKGTTGGATVLVNGACTRCGEAFTRRVPAGQTTRWCSPECRGKGNTTEIRRRRRARLVGAFVAEVNAVEVFDRDGWICQLCGNPVDRNLRHPDLMAASLDHIVPLARGGTHEPDNCQLAHLICNSTKGDKLPELAAH